MTSPVLRAPFPYFGGKSRAAHLVWENLLRRYPVCGRALVDAAAATGGWSQDTVAWALGVTRRDVAHAERVGMRKLRKGMGAA